jgi:hypothetical protein|eukprot:COSAG01_NODE_6887_length_3453_cov_94.174873_6_plen_67_part_00
MKTPVEAPLSWLGLLLSLFLGVLFLVSVRQERTAGGPREESWASILRRRKNNRVLKKLGVDVLKEK